LRKFTQEIVPGKRFSGVFELQEEADVMLKNTNGIPNAGVIGPVNEVAL